MTGSQIYRNDGTHTKQHIARVTQELESKGEGNDNLKTNKGLLKLFFSFKFLFLLHKAERQVFLTLVALFSKSRKNLCSHYWPMQVDYKPSCFIYPFFPKRVKRLLTNYVFKS